MISTKEKAKPSSDYLAVEDMIDKAIQQMEEETHIEYGSTMVRNNNKPVRCKWVKRIIDKMLNKR